MVSLSCNWYNRYVACNYFMLTMYCNYVVAYSELQLPQWLQVLLLSHKHFFAGDNVLNSQNCEIIFHYCLLCENVSWHP